MKDPITDSGKRSRPGRLALVKSADGYKTIAAAISDDENELKAVFRKGSFWLDQTLADIRARADRA